MNIIKPGVSNISKLVFKKEFDADKEYRCSVHTYLYEENGKYTIKHTLTKEIIELTADERNTFLELREHPLHYAKIKDMAEFIRKRYIVEADHDEAKQYKQSVFLLKTMSGEKKGIGTYVIFPTTGCNARCVYCYEEGYAVKTMNPETAARLADYICETRHNDTVMLRWFGGEPTAASHIISSICKTLQQREVPYKSNMVTNASLVTKELAHEAKELWHLEKVQVSLDGARNDYEIRKNYPDPKKYNYDVVMRAIHYLADEGIKVYLRVNADLDNTANIPDFLHDIKNEFGDNENISLYISPLFQAQQSEQCLELYKEIFRLTDLQKELSIPYGTRTEKSLRLRYCMADSLDKSIVITPDGSFNSCEHLPEKNSWGNIFDGITDKAKYDELSASAPIDEKCKKCPFLPECTPFYKNGCPSWFDKCREYHCMRTDYEIRDLLKMREANGGSAENI